MAGAAHVFVQVSLLQIHNLELQPLEDLFQGLAGPVVELFTWEEMEHCACVVGSWVEKGSGPRAGGRATCPRSSLRPSPSPWLSPSVAGPADHRQAQAHSPGRRVAPPTTQGLRASVQTHTFQVQAVDAVSEVCELLGKQSGWRLRREDTCKGQAGP